jgi:hypothetical protein
MNPGRVYCETLPIHQSKLTPREKDTSVLTVSCHAMLFVIRLEQEGICKAIHSTLLCCWFVSDDLNCVILLYSGCGDALQ